MSQLRFSSWYMLKGQHFELARRSITIASSFGLAAALSVVILGDESGYNAGHSQKMKLAAIEAMWETEPAPATFTLFGWPDQEARETKYALHIPYAMGLIGTRSLTQEIPGIEDLVDDAKTRIRSGIVAYDAMMKIREANGNPASGVKEQFEQHSADLGFALLLKRYIDDPRQAGEDLIDKAANDTVPTVWPIFWGFRIMVGLGFSFIAVYAFLHPVSICGVIVFMKLKGHLSPSPFSMVCRLWVFHALVLKWTVPALGQATFKAGALVAIGIFDNTA